MAEQSWVAVFLGGILILLLFLAVTLAINSVLLRNPDLGYGVFPQIDSLRNQFLIVFGLVLLSGLIGGKTLFAMGTLLLGLVALLSALRALPAAGPISAAVAPARTPVPSSTQVTIISQIPEDQFFRDLKCPNCGATVRPTDRECAHCGSQLVPKIDVPTPVAFADVKLDQAISIRHPSRQMEAHVTGRLLYGELWQASRGAEVPWTPTGNYYAGLLLDDGGYLLNWQDRFYILDPPQPLTDMEINRDFAPPAREFARSDQTADVEFQFLGNRWKMLDIGRFVVVYVEGERARFRQKALGRFIHASGAPAESRRALIVEDYQGGGGGQDTLWLGYQISPDAIIT